MINAEHICAQYRSLHGEPPALLVQAPGRVNMIGEHTDYNEGLAMPAAIDRFVWLAFGRSGKGPGILSALNTGENVTITNFAESSPATNHWSAYLSAAALILSERGAEVPSFHCVFGGDLPMGSGLSSSAALSCGALVGLSELSNVHFPRKELAFMAQSIEKRYIGLQCGIMDQIACLFGKKGEAMLLDCATLDMEPVLLDKVPGAWYLVDSGVKHSLAVDSGYNARCRETTEGLEAIRKQFGEEVHFKNLSGNHINAIERRMPIEAQRLRFYIRENERVKAFKGLVVRRGKPSQLGELLTTSHRGLQHDYEATCFETDTLVDLLLDVPDVHGARQVGGGFGGAVLVFAEKAMETNYKDLLSQNYRARTGATCTFLEFSPADGCQPIKNPCE